MLSFKTVQEYPEFVDGTKLSAEHKITLWNMLMTNPTAPSRIILEQSVMIAITIRQFNRLRIDWKLNRLKGRPCKNGMDAKQGCLPVVVNLASNVTFIGVHIFACWVEQQQVFTKVLELLRYAINIHIASNPEDDFPLLWHRDITLLCRFKALFFAPLFGIGKLIEYDVKEHALKTVIGRGYQSSTLNQSLGQLEYVNAAPILMRALIPAKSNGICYIDGHMFAMWTRTPMHKGKITMLGRIMAGSQAVIAHSEDGCAIFVEYYSPDIRLPQIILSYCEKIVSLTGIDLFVIDREINSEAIACAFNGKEWGLLSMLDKNEYKDLSNWDVKFIGEIRGGNRVYQGLWSDGKKKDDPREFVIVDKDGKLLPFWGTPKFVEKVDYLRWPSIYSQRNEIQENDFKRMIAHGALNVNFGTKKIISEDRHQQRAMEKLEEKKKVVEEKIANKIEGIKEQEKKVEESKEKGHGKRLEQRQIGLSKMNDDLKNAKAKHEEIEKKVEELGPPKERGDRDFRKQSIMTFRTLLLNNMLMAFMPVLMACLSVQISLDSIIELFFNRSGAYYGTSSKVVFLLNMDGLSKEKRETLLKLIEGVNQMGLERDGKRVSVQARAQPSFG